MMLWIVYVRDASRTDDLLEGQDGMEIADNLFLVRSGKTRSKLYHSLKRKVKPDGLLVAPLSEPPKFKGMHTGALKWLRSKNLD